MPVLGQITAHGRSKITVEDSECTDLLLITKDCGNITFVNVAETGKLQIREDGGSIRVY